MMIGKLIVLALASAVAVSGTALAARSDWAEAGQSQVRLLLSAPRDGAIPGGVEIVLDPGWHTYWRNPGEAGVPPVFDFSASENVASVEVLYPAPERYSDGSSTSLIYRDEVVFPLSVRPKEAAQPITLRLAATFGVCREICIPAMAAAEVTSAPSSARDPLAEARLALFRKHIPDAPEPGRFDIESVALDGESLLIDVRSPDSGYLDLFAEPPEGWFIGQPAFVSRGNGVSRYSLSLAGRPRDATTQGHVFRFVAIAGGEAIEKAVEIN